MDPQLLDAARSGDVTLLKKAVVYCEAIHDRSYFLSKNKSSKQGKQGNIFHIAAWHGQVEFFREAMKSLSTQIVQFLLYQKEDCFAVHVPDSNPLHIAAYFGFLDIVKLILEYYRSIANTSSENISNNKSPPPPSKPWLARDSEGRTPLHLALHKKQKKCALEIVQSVDDMEFLSNLDDHQGNSLLFLAVKNGCTQVALEILNSDHPYSLNGKYGQTPLVVVPNCSEEVCRLLLEKHPQLLKARYDGEKTVMHNWVRLDERWTMRPLEYLLLDDSNSIAPERRKEFLEQILATDVNDGNPLHEIAECGDARVARILVEAYQQEIAKQELGCLLEGPVPWLRRNFRGLTPLDVAILEEHEDVAMCFLSPEINSVLNHSNEHNPLYLAIRKGKYRIAEEILAKQNEYGWSTGLTSGRGRNILHDASKYKVDAEVVAWLVTKFPSFILEQDEDGKTPLDEASKAGAALIIKVMLEKEPSLLRNVPLAWVEACKRGDLSTIHTFFDNCEYFRELCFAIRDTPLHHIRLDGGFWQYQDFLKLPLMSELKNFQDSSGATPLHTAIRDRNIHLTELLLNMEDVNRSIKDKKGKTPMDLLANVCNKKREWDEMCKRLGIVPGLKATYFQDKTNLLEVRNTLSVVAALLATITFTAGFTLPGGFNNDSGKAILGENAAFLVFLLADTFAMLCSMLVLVFLIWSMVCDRNEALVFIDRSMPLLMLAVYGTILAFMTGVYIVMPHKSLWAAIFILVMGSLVIISSKRSIVFKVLRKLNSVTNKVYQDEIQLLEQGRTSTFQEGSSSSVQGMHAIVRGGSSSEQNQSEPISKS